MFHILLLFKILKDYIKSRKKVIFLLFNPPLLVVSWMRNDIRQFLDDQMLRHSVGTCLNPGFTWTERCTCVFLGWSHWAETESETAAGIWGFPVSSGLVGTCGSFRLQTKHQQKQHDTKFKLRQEEDGLPQTLTQHSANQDRRDGKQQTPAPTDEDFWVQRVWGQTGPQTDVKLCLQSDSEQNWVHLFLFVDQLMVFTYFSWLNQYVWSTTSEREWKTSFSLLFCRPAAQNPDLHFTIIKKKQQATLFASNCLTVVRLHHFMIFFIF